MVPGGFSWFFMVPGQCPWLLLVPGLFSWFFMVSGWFSIVTSGFHGFSWFHVGFSWFQAVFSWFLSKMYLPELNPGPTIQFRSAARRAAKDLVTIKIQMEQ